MAKVNIPPAGKLKPPGSWWQRFWAWFWYGVIAMTFKVGGPFPMFVEIFNRPKKPNYNTMPRRNQETVVLTGGTRGIGEHVLKKLLQLDYNVILGARNPEAGLKVVEKLRDSGVQSGTVKCFPLDLKSLRGVREFSNNVLEATDRIDLLINNAGIMFEPYELTEDGYEVHFHVNYLSHFLLTELLLPTLKSTAESRTTRCRVVNVSSIAHYGSYGSNLKDCHNPQVYSRYRAYFDSKMCQVMSTKYMEVLMRAKGANVSFYAVHPGVVGTDLYNSLGLMGKCMKGILSCFRSADEAAEEIMFAAISPEVENEGGCFIQNSKKKRALKDSEKEKYQKELWDLSRECIDTKLEVHIA